MLRSKVTRVRRKLRVARGRLRNTRAGGSSEGLQRAATAIAVACKAAIEGYELCAERSRDATIAVAARNAAAFLRSLLEATLAVADEHGIDARPRARTCDRLRWEWLASTAMVVDGSPDARLLRECSRVLSRGLADATSATLGGSTDIVARFRVASAEAYSLASALTSPRADATASGTTASLLFTCG